MTVIAVLGSKHSPGVTTLACALGAAAASTLNPLIVEADPAGGDIAARCGLSLDPGLLSLAASGRRGISPDLLDAHSQPLPSGASVLAGPVSAEHAHAAVTGLAARISASLHDRDGLTIIDAGRWDVRSPATELIGAADVVVALLRPTIAGVEHARSRIESLDGRPIIPVMIGEHPYPASEVRAVLGTAVLHVVADDGRAAATVGSGVPLDRWLRRSSYMRSVTALLELATEFGDRKVVAS